ncbi:ArsR family transcriptional regulator [archaeon]|nr:MAG: ArsR family transcriptional regulator [archaeon]
MRRMYAAVIFILLLMLCSFPCARAQDPYSILSYEATVFPSAEGSVEEDLSIELDVSSVTDFTVTFAYPVEGVMVSVDGIPATFDIVTEGQASTIIIPTLEPGVHRIDISFRSMMLSRVSDQKLVYSPTFSFNTGVDRFMLRVVMPPTLFLSTPLTPEPTATYAQGNALVVEWEREPLGKALYVLIGMQHPSDEHVPWYYMLVLVVLFPFGWYVSRRYQSRAMRYTTDEQLLLSKLDDGPLSQPELVDATSFSKAKVSRMLSDLEKKGLVSRRRYRNKNIIEKL